MRVRRRPDGVWSGRACGAAAVCTLLLGGAAPVAAQRADRDTTEVHAVRFAGVRAVDEAILATAIVTSGRRCNALRPLCWFGIGVEPQYLDELALAQDVLRLRIFYYQRGYRETHVASNVTAADGGVRVTFAIEEGVPVRVASLEVEGTEDIVADVTRNLPLRVGAPFDIAAYDATRDSLALRLRNRGYASAEVLRNADVPRDSLVAHVRYEAIAGPRARFGPVTVEGAARVSPEVVRRMLLLRPGDLYTVDALLRSQRNLFSQEVFRHAEIRAVPESPEDTVVPVLVRVNEANLRRVRMGLGLSSADFVTTEGRWISRNFYGGARRLELRGRVSNLMANQLSDAPVFESSTGIYRQLSGLLSVDLTQPWVFGPLNSFNTGVYLERRSLPGLFVRTAVGGYVTQTHAVSASGQLTTGYRPELTRLDTEEGDLIFCLGFVACGDEEIEALSRAHWLSPLTMSFVLDRSNSLFAPSRGFVVRAEGEFAARATGSDFSYSRLTGELIDYSTLRPGFVLATRMRPGAAWATQGGDSSLGVHPTRRFFAGGPNSVRGFAQFRLGPKLLTADAARLLAVPVDSGGAGCTALEINEGNCDASTLLARNVNALRVQPVGGAAVFEGNIELRFPVYRDVLRGVAFVDAGQVWPDRRSVRLSELVWTPGLGVRYFSPIGPMRVDIGYNTAGAERLTPVTTAVEYCPPDEAPVCRPILPDVDYDHRHLRNLGSLRAQRDVLWNPRTSFWNRLQFHFSIGQAF